MSYVDAAILDVTEFFCRKFQVLTGRTNVWLAIQLTNLSVILYFAWAGLYSFTADPVERAVLVLFCGGLMYALARTIFRVPIESYERSAYARAAKGLRNPRRVRDAFLRIAFLTLAIALAYPVSFVYVNLHSQLALLGYALVVLTTGILYLLACDPLPPCEGRAWSWLRAGKPAYPVGDTTGEQRSTLPPAARTRKS